MKEKTKRILWYALKGLLASFAVIALLIAFITAGFGITWNPATPSVAWMLEFRWLVIFGSIIVVALASLAMSHIDVDIHDVLY